MLSILFVDLVGFTASSDKADPEDVRARVRPYYERLEADVSRYGGQVEKYLGDGVLAVFGAAAAHEDDPERAVRAALAIQDSISTLNQELPDLGLKARVAVTTGEAVVARRGTAREEVVGDVVNTAARLQQVVAPGGVVVDEPTYQATYRHVYYEEMEPVEVKGKQDPIPVWRAQGARGRFGIDVDDHGAAPLVGRVAELSLLKDTFTRAITGSSVHMMTITGEPGAGKSRLIWEFRKFVDELPELVWWRQGRCLPYGDGITFWALSEIVKSHAGIFETDDSATAEAKLRLAIEALVSDSAEAEWMVSALQPLIGGGEAPSGPQDDRVFAWRRFVEYLAEDNPLVLVFEDIHWADPPMLSFIEGLAENVFNVPLIVVCAARPELYELHAGWGGGKRNSSSIALGPLSDAETATLVTSLLGDVALDEATRQRLIEQSGGNPLYAGEFVRMLENRGLIDRERGRLTLTDDLPIPESIPAIVAARLDLLADEDKTTVQAAAVMGKVFWSGSVEHLISNGFDVRSSLRRLTDYELVHPVRSSTVPDSMEYSFWHSLVRDVAYGRITRTDRLRLHVKAAEWIEQTLASRVVDAAELLVYHYGEAVRISEEVGGDRETLQKRLGEVLELAGDRNTGLDLEKASAFYRRALDLATEEETRASRLVKLGEAERDGGHLVESVGHYQQALAFRRGRGDELGEAELLIELSGVKYYLNEAVESNELLEQARVLTEPYGETEVLARLRAVTAARLWLRGESINARAAADEAFDLVEQYGSPEDRIRIRWARGGTRIEQGDIGGIDDLRDALDLAKGSNLGHLVGISYINYAELLLRTQGADVAWPVAVEGLEFTDRRGLATSHSFITTTAAEILLERAEWDRAIDYIEIARRETGSGGSYTQAQLMMLQALIDLERGDGVRAIDLVGVFMPLARQGLDVQILAPAFSVAALVMSRGGDQSLALEYAEEFRKITDDHPWFRAELMDSVVTTLIAAGRVEDAVDLVHDVTPVGRQQSAMIEMSQAMIDEALGDLRVAKDRYATAAQGLAAIGHRFTEAIALLGLGRVALKLEHNEEAKEALRASVPVFELTGATSRLAEARRLLDQVG